ncbi:MAG TPA: hypothetical protein VFZ66_04025 [Herpetosiphonaceae bacterium]
MTAEPDGDYTTLVVRLQTAADGTWYVYVDGTPEALPLKPVTLVIRLWQHSSGILRGTIRLHDSDQWAPIQSNARLEELIRAWLLPGSNPPGQA